MKAKHHDLLSLLIILVSVLGLGVFTYQYLVNWQNGYSSDTALIGLMAKSILEQGERPIFVWTVGYQGMLLEGYTTALFFALFGVDPVVHNFAPALYMWLGLAVWGWVLTRTFGLRTASLALLATVCSTPLFYTLNLRTMPNFPEIMFLGGLIFLVFDFCVKQHTKAHDYGGRKQVLLGFLFGFSLYTFALSVFYVLAVGVITCLILSKELQNAKKVSLSQTLREYVDVLIFPWMISTKISSGFRFWRKPLFVLLMGLGGLAWTALLVAAVTFFFPLEDFVYSGRRIRWNALGIMMGAVILLVLPGFVFTVSRAVMTSKVARLSFQRLGIGFLVGYAPALYYKLTGGASIKNAAAYGNWPEVSMRLGIYNRFHQELMHWQDIWTGPLAGYYFACVIAAVIISGLSLRAYFQLSRTKTNPHPLWIYAVFSILVLLVFSVSKTVVDDVSKRYLILLVPIYAMFLARVTQLICRVSVRAKYIAALAFIGIIITGAIEVYQDSLRTVSSPFGEIAEQMKARGLQYGYADYWLAYATVFLSKEEVILEPLYSNYAPQYGPVVAAAERIAYVDFVSSKFTVENDILTVHNQRYQVDESLDIRSDVKMLVLKRVP